MSDREEFRPIVWEIDYLLAKRSQKTMERPRLVVIHGHHQPETVCLHGETVKQAFLVFDRKEYSLCLSPTGLLILDCLARHCPVPLTAMQIKDILSTDPFYLRHGANTLGGGRAVVRANRASIKVCIQRIRVQLRKTLMDAGLALESSRILISEATDNNIVAYRLGVIPEFRHCQF